MGTTTLPIDVKAGGPNVTIKIESKTAQIFRCVCSSIDTLENIPPKQTGSHRVVFEVPAKEDSPYAIYTYLADEGPKTRIKQTAIYDGKSKSLTVPTKKSAKTFRHAFSGVYLY